MKQKVNNLVQSQKRLWTKLIFFIKNHLFLNIILLVLFILLLFVLKLFINNSDYMNKKRIFLAEKKYNQAHELYFYGKGLDYSSDENSILISKQKGKDYFKLNTVIYLQNNFTDKEQNDIYNFFDILEVNGNFYIKDFGRGLSGYYGTEFDIKKVSKNKISFIAKSKFCRVEDRKDNDCKSEEYYYTIDKPFVLVKENGSWKIDEYTSVFEFSDSEFK